MNQKKSEKVEEKSPTITITDSSGGMTTCEIKPLDLDVITKFMGKPVKDIIRDRRIELNMTMRELSVAVGVSEGTVSRGESGEISNMRRGPLVKLSKVLGIPPNVLMGWPDLGYNDAPKTSPDLSTPPDLAEAIYLYKSLDDADRGVIRGEMKGMLRHPKYNKQLDIAASGLDENTEAGLENIRKALDKLVTEINKVQKKNEK